MRKPLYNAFLQNDLAGNGKVVDDLAGLQVEYKTVRECCIGVRLSGKTGSGSYDDPWDVSTTAKFDAVMRDTSKAARTNTLIRIRDGEFTHSGHRQGDDSVGWRLRAGSKLIGEGPGKTILKLDPATVIPIYGMNCIGTDIDDDNDGAYVGFMTVDGNYQNLSNPNGGKLNGVVLYGHNTTIERVHHKGGFGTWPAIGIGNIRQESFGLLLQGALADTTLTHNQKVLNCVVDGYLGTYGGGITVVGRHSDNACIGAVISGCRVEGYRDADQDFTNTAMGGIGSGGGTIENCTIDNCQKGIYCENGLDVKIVNNIMTNIYEIGIRFDAVSAIDRLVIFGNTIKLRGDAVRRWGISFSDADNDVALIRGAKVIANTVVLDPPDDDNPSLDYNPIFVGGLFTGRGYSFIGNTVEQLDSNLTVRIPTDAYSSGNRQPDNSDSANLPDQMGTGNIISDTAFGSSWNGEVDTAPTQNSVYDIISTIQQAITLTPTTAGWYRIITSSSFSAGRVRIFGSYGSGYTDVEFAYDAFGYNAGMGSFQTLRSIRQGGGEIVDQVRSSNNGAAGVYVDIHFTYVTTPGPITIVLQGATVGAGTLAAGAVGADVSTNDDVLVHDLTKQGFNTTAHYSVADVQVVGARDTGWTPMTGSGSKGAMAANVAGDASAGYVEAEMQSALNRIAALEARLFSLDVALTAHGLIGA